MLVTLEFLSRNSAGGSHNIEFGFAPFLGSAQMVSIDARDIYLGDFFRTVATLEATRADR